MKIAITGTSGLIGSTLVKELLSEGNQVIRLVRSREEIEEDSLYWDPMTGEGELEKLEGVDAVINLAGENISSGRWTKEKKKRIHDSRVVGTENLCKRLETLSSPPKVLINASAIGYYGDCGDEEVTEESPPGKGFLSLVCQHWEKATEKAEAADIRVVRLRIGVVLSNKGGMLSRMLPPFRLGLGGAVGSGEQYMSWIVLEDLVNIIKLALVDARMKGSFNAVAPAPVTNKTFTKALGKVLHRPTLLPMPSFVVKAMLGEMGRVLMLEGAAVVPWRLQELGFTFKHETIDKALESLLKK